MTRIEKYREVQEDSARNKARVRRFAVIAILFAILVAILATFPEARRWAVVGGVFIVFFLMVLAGNKR